ncbi:zinc finger protein 667-like [Calliphora vicina]|uniref:zinc finger protein 667-like n=1 Tax=Calliphora vicina TaxID=7373 RepID=UPI00325B15A7
MYPSNSFIVTEYPNEISDDDTEHSNHVNNTDITKSYSSATTFACNECNKLFTSVSKLNRHKRFTHAPEEEKIPCHLCDLKFARTYHFKRHVQTVHSRDKFQPKVVKKDKPTLASEIATTVTCQECNKIFYNPKKLARHKRLVHVPEEKKFTCTVCGNKFGRSDHFRRHVQTVHSRDNFQPKVVKKDKPTKLTSKQTKLTSEIATTVTCQECNKIFYNPNKLTRHKRLVHVPEEKKFTCTVCGNKFGRSDHFRRHMRNLHNAEAILPEKREIKIKDNRFACDKCDRSYTRRCRLYKHERELHSQ